MNKIPSVFLRNPENLNEMTRNPNPLCQWVLDGEGVATRKYDGTCVMLDDDGAWWARREVKPGKQIPPNFKPVETDDHTGKTMGWIPIEESSYKKFLDEAVLHAFNVFKPGTYELCGPRIGQNPEKFSVHTLVHHGTAAFIYIDGPMDYDNIKATIQTFHENRGWEGLVWHHPDGRMAKMKARDYNKEQG